MADFTLIIGVIFISASLCCGEKWNAANTNGTDEMHLASRS